jgi:DNA-binding LytR/AlgR family response regulator
MKCVIIDDDPISISLMEQCVSKVPELQLLKSLSNPIEATTFVRQNEVDLIFLDIEMPEMNGIDLVKSLAKQPYVIVMSSEMKYAVDAFDIDVDDFLVKPIDLPRFLKAVSKVIERSKRRDDVHDTGSLFVKSETQYVKLKFEEILWIEAMADYVIINTLKDRITIYSSMKGIEAKLPANDFLRVHRSYIIRLDKIKTFDSEVIVIEQKIIPIGITYKDKLFKRINYI